MSNLRMFLLLGLFTVGFLIWQQWQIDYGPRPPVASAGDQVAPDMAEDLPAAEDIPAAADVPAGEAAPVTDTPAPAVAEGGDDGREITVHTDLLELTISTRGGSLVAATLLEYPVALQTPEVKVQLFGTDGGRFYVAQTGLVSNTHPAPNHYDLFNAPQDHYELTGDQLVVPLTWRGDGVTVVREYVFRRGSYAIEVRDRVENATGDAWRGSAYRQLQRTPPPEEGGSAFTNPKQFSFTGPAIYTPEEKYEKFDFDDIDGPISVQAAGQAWIAMVQHYFFSAWIPPADQPAVLELRSQSDNRYIARALSPAFSVAPGASETRIATLYVGPKLQDTLDDLAPGLSLTVDYGIFTPFSKILYWLLEKIHMLVGNWGWAIVLLTVLVKAAFFKLTEAQYKSMAKLRKLQPRITALKERYGDDRQAFQMKMMEIYKEEKVNPLGGCLPVLIQIPVFIALYWVLVESVELRQAPFILWINDLSSPDPYFILPIINGAAMFMTTKLSPNPAADPIQQKIMLAMPLVFSVMFAFFQSGLVLYWAVNASLSLAQQWVITKRIEAS